MGPKTRKRKEIDKVATEKEVKSMETRKKKESEKSLGSNNFKKKCLDASELHTSNEHLQPEPSTSKSVSKPTLSLTNKGSVAKSKPKTSKSKLTLETSLSCSFLKPSSSNTREVTVDQNLDVDTVKKMIQDRENRKARAAKRLADLTSVEFNQSTNENSQNLVNFSSESKKIHTKRSFKSNCDTVDFSEFPNVTKFFLGRQVFGKGYISNREVQNWFESKKLLDFKLLDRESFVEARITNIIWNKVKPNQFGFSDKHGDIVVGELQQRDKSLKWKLLLQKIGIGPGGNILSMKFAKSHKPDHYTLWHVGLEGIVVRYDLAYDKEIVPLDVGEESGEMNYQGYLHTNDINHWYASMDLSPEETLIASGCTKGYVQAMTPDGEVVERFRASKMKVSHVEFCPKNPLLLATASLDKTVKIWDRRYLKSLTGCIANLQHEKGINSAYFNSNSDMLLTTDQYDEIRTYETSSWQMMSSINHPHRQFQHLTPIKATWHASADIILAGRYPIESNDPRCINVLTVEGQNLCTLDSISNKIQSVVRGSPDGKYVMASFGCGVELWGMRNDLKHAA